LQSIKPSGGMNGLIRGPSRSIALIACGIVPVALLLSPCCYRRDGHTLSDTVHKVPTATDGRQVSPGSVAVTELRTVSAG
jgi:hypothetical protein